MKGKILFYASFIFLMVMCFLMISSIFAFASSCNKGEGTCSVLKREAEARKTYMLKESLKHFPLTKGYPPPPSTVKKARGNEISRSFKKEKGISGRIKDGKKRKHTRKKSFYKSIKRKVATYVVSTPVEVYPDKTVRVRISSRELNRVVCTDGEIGYVYSSSEKGFEAIKEKTEMFIKVKSYYNPQKGRLEPNLTSAVFYIRCGDYTFSFIAQPDTKVSARTIYLVVPSRQKVSSLDLFKINRVDEAVVKIVRSVFLDNIPSSWIKIRDYVPLNIIKELPVVGKALPDTERTIKNKKEKKKNTVKIKFAETARYKIPGIKVIIRVFSISLVRASEDDRVQLNEKIFLDPAIVDAPLAISLRDHILNPLSPTKAVVLERTPSIER